MDGVVSETLKAALLVALRMKGESVAEIAGAAAAMRRRAIPIPHERAGAGGHLRHGRRRPRHLQHLDRRGPGGGGGRGAGGQARQPLGLQPLRERRRAGRPGGEDRDRLRRRPAAALDTVGIAFLFAPLLHPAMREVMPVRRELGLRTIFNVLGPLTNPAGARRQVMGVYSREPGGADRPRARATSGPSTPWWSTATAWTRSPPPAAPAWPRCGTARCGSTRLEPERFGLRRARLEDLAGGAPGGERRRRAPRLRRRDGAAGGHHRPQRRRRPLRRRPRRRPRQEGVERARETLGLGGRGAASWRS